MDDNLPTGETMSEGSALPPGGPALAIVAKPAAPMTEDAVPLAALAAADDSSQMQTPGVGDRVSYTVDGKIIRIEGDRAFIKKESVNGQDVAGAAEEPAGDEPDSIDKLTSDASAMDQASEGGGAGQGY